MDVNLGRTIREKLRQQGRTVTWFASQLNCNRSNIYKILNKSSIDIDLLRRICVILGYNFFAALSHEVDETIGRN
ncbi:MAG: helix-turn-helix transcriptional regulator [Bacteroidales bacterium]|nr:helix-turn-helix transcriptional regulator [Bacteroidales bacterium]